MNVYGRVTVFPIIPPRISKLHEIAYNLWWTWHVEARALYAKLDPILWDLIGHNPVLLLTDIDAKRLETAADDESYLAEYDVVCANFDAYMFQANEETWFAHTYPQFTDKTIAYFSAEFGLHESLPIYSGGLGILSGDHCKEASDLGLPFVGVGFLYPQGYFHQKVNRDGHQEATYDKLHFSEIPTMPACDSDGNEIMISVELPGRSIHAKIWKIQVGRIPIYLLDTDVTSNAPYDRELSARLYGGDWNVRLAQEIVLGIGGVRALRALGICPSAWHINEGHAAFLNLERCREFVQSGLTFAQAREVVAANSLFTTHTPVAAGNDTFGLDLIDKYFGNYWESLGLSREQFIDIARQDQGWGASFGMTVLALKLTGLHNGVSALHGSVSRKMWQFLWQGIDSEEVPITSVTNGVHTRTWISQEMDALLSEHVDASWKDNVDDFGMWSKLSQVSDQAFWEVHQQRKVKLLYYARRRLHQQHIRLGEGKRQMEEIESMLHTEVCTIGFGRRFATYKRATLLFRDIERLRSIVHNSERPVQIIFAGKAHPADEPGKGLIESIYRLSRSDEFRGKVVFLENYDMDMARMLVAGCDVWLNTPIRPHEASGTSGEKASLNGVPNCSILDGWWAEGYNGQNGWAIGESREYYDQDEQAAADSDSLYQLLENEILPIYYEKDASGLPHQWIGIMKEAMRSCAPVFSMRRMVKEYTSRFYIEQIQQGMAAQRSNYAEAKNLAAWKEKIYSYWNSVELYIDGQRDGQLSLGDGFEIYAWIKMRELLPTDIAVEVVYGTARNEEVIEQQVLKMQYVQQEKDGSYRFELRLQPIESGSIAYNVRVLPNHPALFGKHDMALVKWT